MTEFNNKRTIQTVTHEDITQALKAVDSDNTASEAHGVISGVLCVSGDDKGGSKWVSLLLSDAAQMEVDAAKKLSILLMYLHQNTLNALKADDFTFDLILPDDNKTKIARVEALADWCRGYLLGLSVHGTGGKQNLPAHRKEFIEDLIAISNVQAGQEHENEAESYLMELHEFVRIGVQTVFDENQIKTG